MDEAELLAKARSGDPAAFDGLVAGYRGELKAHCYRMPWPDDIAADEPGSARWVGRGSPE